MIRAIITAAALVLTGLPAFAIDIQEVTSPGGIKVWLVEDHSIPFTAVSIDFKGGASVDAPGKRGAINLMTALLEEGSGERDATAFAEAVEASGARFRFDVSDDVLSVDAQLLSANRDAAADLLAGALAAPRFDPPAVERVRGQVQAIIRSDAVDPGAIAQLALARTIWGDHPYGSSINGTADSVAGLTSDDLRAAKDRVMARDRVFVSASGDITAAQAGALADRILGGLPAAATAPLPAQAAPTLTGDEAVIDWDSPQTVVYFAGAGLPIDDPDYYAAEVADYILGGGGFSSRLTDEIREKRGLTYGVSTSLSSGLFGDAWVGGMATGNAGTDEAVRLVKQEWARMAEGVSDAELANAKTYMTGEYPLRFDGNRKIAGILSGMQVIGLPRDHVNTRNSKVEGVTAADVSRVAQRLLRPEALTFVLVGRPQGV